MEKYKKEKKPIFSLSGLKGQEGLPRRHSHSATFLCVIDALENCQIEIFHIESAFSVIRTIMFHFFLYLCS